MNKKITFLAVFGFLIGLKSQIGYHQVPTSDKGNPKDLSKDLDFNFGVTGASPGWTSIVSGSCTNTWTSELTLPFNFKFNNEAVTKYKVNCDGVVSFSAPTNPISGTITSLPNAGIPDKSITLYGLKMVNTTNEAIITKTFGTAPNRQFWIQWNSATETNIGASGWVYMSIVLEETTNNIYIVDQRVSANNKAKIVAGIQIDATNALFLNNMLFTPVNSNLTEPTDNSYFTFKPGKEPEVDAKLNEITIVNYLESANAPFVVKYNVSNNGKNPITSLKVSYQINSNTEVIDEITGLNIAKGKTSEVSNTTKWSQTTSGVYDVKVNILEVNGLVDSIMDNTSTKSVAIGSGTFKRKVLHEVFTSSTCPPCKPGNENLHSIIDDEPDDQTSVKFQMNYPGTGDPYFNTENNTRHNFYGIGGIPYTAVNGNKFNGNANAYTQEIFDGIKPIKTFFQLQLDAKNLWQNKMTCNVTINPKITINNPNVRLFVVVVEKETSNNVKSNGETNFLNVAKKIMPSASGETIASFVDGVPYTKTFTYAFKGSYVLPASGAAPANLNTQNTIENWSNLGIVAYLQDIVTKDVLQSEFANMSNNGIEDISHKMNMYPNPTSENTLIDINAFKGKQTKVELINMLGQVVFTANTLTGQCLISTENVPSGLYTVKASNTDAFAAQKLTVIK